MSDTIIGRRKRGKIKPHHIARMHNMVKAAADNGYDCESTSMDSYGDEGSPTMSMRLRPKRRGGSKSKYVPSPSEGPGEPTNA